MADGSLSVELIYAQAHGAVSIMMTLAPGSRVADALRLAAGDARFAGLALAAATVGIFGSVVPHEQLLKNGDRIEIYRPLADDPKSARRTRAREAAKTRR